MAGSIGNHMYVFTSNNNSPNVHCLMEINSSQEMHNSLKLLFRDVQLWSSAAAVIVGKVIGQITSWGVVFPM